MRWTWREGPAEGPPYRRGRWQPPDVHLCTEHQAAEAKAEHAAELAKLLADSGLPKRLQVYSWDRVQEYRKGGKIVAHADRAAVTHAAFQRYQAELPEGTLGITPWNKSLARTLRRVCEPGTRVRSWVIMGPVGSGKSTLVAAAVAGLLGRGVPCRYVTEADLWAMVRAQWGRVAKKHHQAPDVVQQLVDVDVLALDDLGTIEQPRPWHVDGMERLVCGRYDAGRPMLITSNATLQQLADTYGERVGSRLVEMIGRGRRYVRLGGPDWRTGLIRADEPAQAAAAPEALPCSECGHSPCRGGGACS